MSSYMMSPASSDNTRISLSQVYFLYQSSLQFFLGVFQMVLSGNTNLKEMVERLHIITYHLFKVCMERLCVVWYSECVRAVLAYVTKK